MFARAASGTIVGVDAHNVTVESHRANGLPGMAVIGLARGAMKESSVRVRSAIVAAGIKLGSHRLVVNLLPAELPKEASSLDLALAVSLLASGEVLPLASLEGRRFIGELSLGGALEPVRGAVLMADLARRRGDRELLVPHENAAEAAIVPGVRVVGVRHLGDLIAHLCGSRPLPPAVGQVAPPTKDVSCLSDVFGQKRAKRALEIAAAGGHNLLMIGPPGSGKTMLAHRLRGLLPALSTEQAVEVTRVHSAAGGARPAGLMQQAPFRAPHHTASEPALCGGGPVPRPGEITLAHRGVLFLDELPEFSRRALESLREPLESGCIHIARAGISLRFPADVLLLAAMNPCPCGHAPLGSPPAASAPPQGPLCLCAFERIQRYRGRVSGPLLDRIDLHVPVQPVPYRDLLRRGSGETSAQVRERVRRARAAQQQRFAGTLLNSRMTAPQVRQEVPLSAISLRDLEAAAAAHGLSARAIAHILRVARTIADLAGEAQVNAEHLRESIGFRLLDRAGPTPAVDGPQDLRVHRVGDGCRAG